MKALSIHQPWAWLITNGIKNIENRDWSTDYRGFLLIHAGKKPDEGAKLIGILRDIAPEYLDVSMKVDMKTGGIVGYATLQKVVTKSDSPWFRGKYGFVLTQRHPVPFIPLRGQLGLFDVPAEIEAQINEIRDQRFWEAEMAEQYQIAKEWRDYRLQGDERGSYES